MTKMVSDEFDESELFPAPIIPQKSGNPLASYYRMPGINVPLPTGGAFFPEGGIELDDANEVGVLAMRASDELLLSSPDALMNNTAVMKLIESCVPAIKIPEMVSSPDLDVLLLAIRFVSSGNEMEIELACPKCKEANTMSISITDVLATSKPVPPENPVRITSDVIIYVRPHSLKVQTKVLVTAFKQTRIAQGTDNNTELSDEERAVILGQVMKELDAVNKYSMVHSVVKIVVPGAVVENPEYIAEFFANTDKKTLTKVSAAIEGLNKLGVDKNVEAQCSHCEHEWTSPLEFNPATFFEGGSSD